MTRAEVKREIKRLQSDIKTRGWLINAAKIFKTNPENLQHLQDMQTAAKEMLDNYQQQIKGHGRS